MPRRRRSINALLFLALAALAFTPSLSFAQPRLSTDFGTSFDSEVSNDATSTPQIAAAYQRRADELLLILQGSQREADFFAPSFIEAVPIAQFRPLVGQLKAQYGEPLSIHRITNISASDGTVEIAYEQAIISIKMIVDQAAPFPVIGLLVTGLAVQQDEITNISTQIAALPGMAGFAISDIAGGQPQTISAFNGDQQLAIASAFKLYVLAELARSVESGQRRWDDVVLLAHKSLPSGILQSWPDQTPLTLQSLATLMISISDNSAADILIHELGRSNIAKLLRRSGHSDPDRTLPILTTLEAFALKMPANSDLQQRYAAGDNDQQAALLTAARSRLTRQSVSMANFAAAPRDIDTIEWFASPNDLNRLLALLRRSRDPVVREILQVNPIIAPGDAMRWRYLGGKGGSEPGVIAFSFIGESNSGKNYAISAMWNNPEAPVDTPQFLSLVSRLLNLMAAR